MVYLGNISVDSLHKGDTEDDDDDDDNNNNNSRQSVALLGIVFRPAMHATRPPIQSLSQQ